MTGSPSELTRLADVASDRCTGEAVAIVRGFDRSSRERALTLRTKLRRRGVPTIDVTPLTAAMRRQRPDEAHTGFDGRHVGLVLDTGVAAAQAQRLAAELGVPVLRPHGKLAPARHRVLGVFVDNTLTAVALDSVDMRPLDDLGCQLAVAQGDDPQCLLRGALRLALEHPEVGRAEQITVTTEHNTFTTADDVRVSAHWGSWAIAVDGMDHGPLSSAVRVRCLVDRIEQITA